MACVGRVSPSRVNEYALILHGIDATRRIVDHTEGVNAPPTSSAIEARRRRKVVRLSGGMEAAGTESA
jgi:hypothetical protein